MSIVDAIEAYEALRWPTGKIPGGKRLASNKRRQSGAAGARPKVRCKIGWVSYSCPLGAVKVHHQNPTPSGADPWLHRRGMLGNERPLFIRPALKCGVH